jgi:hypothetical protein
MITQELKAKNKNRTWKLGKKNILEFQSVGTMSPQQNVGKLK